MKSGDDLPENIKQFLPSKPLILFDGVCNLCQGSVQFAISRDKNAKLMFASLQSEIGEKIRTALNINDSEINTIIFIDSGKVYTRSTAALNVAKYLDGGWKYLSYLKIFPRFIRDTVYKIIARYRYVWFGKQSECWLPTPDLKKRFL